MKSLFQSTLFLVAALLAFNLAALVGVVAFSSHGINRISQEEDREIKLAITLIEDAYRLKVALERQMVGLRSYMATGQEELLRPWHEAQGEFQGAAAALEANIKDDEGLRHLRLVRDLEAQHRAQGEKLVALVKRNRRTEAQTHFLTEVSPRKPTVIAAADRLIQAQRNQVDRIHQEVDRAEDQVRWQLYMSALVSVPISLLLAAGIAWRVAVPLRELATASRAIARGQPEVRVPRHYDDEFGQVATAFNSMAGAVEGSLRSLKETNEELLRVDRYRDDFLSMVTHELKTPLTAIMGFASMLERGRHGALSEAQQQSVHKIMSNATRMSGLVNDLLDSTVIRQGQLELAAQPTPYARLLVETAAQMQPMADLKHIQLQIEPPPGVTPRIDAARIAQVITNLLSNALKVTPEGGRVVVRAQLQDDELVTEVIDTGPGIAADDLTRLFQPFTKLNRETSGTGLGLSISKAIVEAHGGRIGVTSTPGAGSTFFFRLPLG